MSVDPSIRRAAEHAIDAGAELLRRGRRDIGSILPKSDRDHATAIDLRIEETLRAVLERAVPGVGFLGDSLDAILATQNPWAPACMWMSDSLPDPPCTVTVTTGEGAKTVMEEGRSETSGALMSRGMHPRLRRPPGRFSVWSTDTSP